MKIKRISIEIYSSRTIITPKVSDYQLQQKTNSGKTKTKQKTKTKMEIIYLIFMLSIFKGNFKILYRNNSRHGFEQTIRNKKKTRKIQINYFFYFRERFKKDSVYILNINLFIKNILEFFN